MRRARVSSRCARWSTILPLLVLSALCWAVTLWWTGGADSGPGGDPGPLGVFTAMWTLTMAAMMLPSVWPVVLVYRGLQGKSVV